MNLYLNPHLCISLQTVPACATVKLTFPQGRETFLYSPGTTKPDRAKNECPLDPLNAHERRVLSQAVRLLRPGTEVALPWPAPAEPPVPAFVEAVSSSVKLRERFTRALGEAHWLHLDKRREGTEILWLTHLLAVTTLVLDYGGDEDQAITALLQNALEQVVGNEERFAVLQERFLELFGERVIALAKQCINPETTPGLAWREQQEAHLHHLENAPPEALLVVAADRLHHTRTLAVQLDRHGAGLWKNCRGGREGTLWYLQRTLFIAHHRLGGPLVSAFHRSFSNLDEADHRTQVVAKARPTLP